MPELRQWAPSRWSEDKVMRFLRHVDDYMVHAMQDLVGFHEGNILAAQMRAEYAFALSVTLLNADGVQTIGPN